jgi:hypothetical protein
MKKKKMKSLILFGRKWFDYKFGNTYHSVSIVVDSICVHRVPFEYGYGDQYVQTAVDWLREHGYLSDWERDDNLRVYFERKGIDYYSESANVGRKKDL